MLQGVSAWWKEKAQSRAFLLSRSFFAESPWTSFKQNQTLTAHNANRYGRVRFYKLVEQPLSKQLYTHAIFDALLTTGSERKVLSQQVSLNYNYYTSDSLWKIWLVESIQSIHNSLWTRHDKCNIYCRYCIYHVKFKVCLVTKPLWVFSSETKWLNASLLFLRMNYVKNV